MRNYNKKIYAGSSVFGADVKFLNKSVRSSTLGNFADYGFEAQLRDFGQVKTGMKITFNNDTYLVVSHNVDKNKNNITCARHDFEQVTIVRRVQSEGKISTTNDVEIGTYEAVITQLYEGYIVDKNGYKNDLEYVLVLPKGADVKSGDTVYGGYVTRVLPKEYTVEILVSAKGA